MKKLVTKTGGWIIWLIFIVCLGPALISATVAFGGEEINWRAFKFCIACSFFVVYSGVELVRAPIRTIIDENGIADKQYRFAVIPWEKITGASIEKVRIPLTYARMKMICLDVVDPDKYKKLLGSYSRWALGDRPITILGTGTNASNEEVLELISSYIELHKNSSKSENHSLKM